MDKIIDFKTAKNKRDISERYFHSDDVLHNDVNAQLKLQFIDATNEILSSWREHAVNDSLNQLIIDSFKDRIIDKSLNYISDLNAIAKLENHIRLSPLILGPGATAGNSIGWGAGFYLNGLLIATPEFSSEVYARCFNVLLYAKLRFRT